MKVSMQQGHVDAMNRHLAPATLGWSYPGNVFDGLSNGLATGFLGDAMIPEAAASDFKPQRAFVASAGADLATPVAYWLQKHPVRLRVGSTTAAAVPNTSGIFSTISERVMARGILKARLADIDAAAQILVDQGGLLPLPCLASRPWQAAFHVAHVTNGDILAANGAADVGVVGGAVAVDPTAVINANAVIFRIGAGKIQLISVATTETVIAQRGIPSGDFVLWFNFDPSTRFVNAFIDNDFVGKYELPTAVTAMEIGARVYHQAAYTAADHAPIGVDFDSLVVNCPVQIA